MVIISYVYVFSSLTSLIEKREPILFLCLLRSLSNRNCTREPKLSNRNVLRLAFLSFWMMDTKNTVASLESRKCTGCLLCYNICPEDAIFIGHNSEGFVIPKITEKCISCGICYHSCPEISGNYLFNSAKTSHAVMCKEPLRSGCGSGGVFAALSEKVISDGGVVYGATYSDDCREVSLARIDKKKNLGRIYKSKYLQASADDAYSNVKHDLSSGKKVLFSGCPCQVNALKVFLKKDYENLTTLDILCHGVPSPLAYNYFLDEVSKGKKIVNVDFRDKKYGWGKLISVKFSDGSIHYDPHNGNYLEAFSTGLSMRECCFSCPFSRPERVGDLTLGDFWGIKQHNPDYDDGKGTSLVVCNTEKGINLFNKISEYTILEEEIPYETVIDISKRANGALIRPTYRPKMRNCFFNHLIKGDTFSKSVRYAKTSLLDVGIVGWWNETSRSNYGSTLTNFALYRYLESLGLSVALISPPNFNRKNAGEFNKKYGYRMTAMYDVSDMGENNKYIDTFVVGSDVLWYYDAFIKSGHMMMLDFVDDDKRMISYSTSFGNTKRFFPDHEVPFINYLLKRFDSVSVRENEGVEICRDVFGIEATQVLDPVFLCDMSVWEVLAQNAERKTSGEYIFSYVLDPTKEYVSKLQSLSEESGLPVVHITDRQFNKDKKEELLKDKGLLANASIEELIHHLMNAKYVVSDSYHGMCFSLIFRKDFLALVNHNRGSSRFETLNDLFKIKAHLIDDPKEISIKRLNVDYTNLGNIITREAERSRSWLINALEKDVSRREYDVTDAIIRRTVLLDKKVRSIKR